MKGKSRGYYLDKALEELKLWDGSVTVLAEWYDEEKRLHRTRDFQEPSIDFVTVYLRRVTDEKLCFFAVFNTIDEAMKCKEMLRLLYMTDAHKYWKEEELNHE